MVAADIKKGQIMTTDMQNDRFDDLLAVLHQRARRLTACPDEAADMAQDTALKIWQARVNGKEMDNMQAYAMTALRNLAASRWRDRKPWEELQEDMASTPPDAPRRIACAELRAAIVRLPRAQAELMDLVAGGETSPAQLARITGHPVGTVMSRLARARVTLRADMGLGKTAPSDALYDPEV